MSSSAPSSGSDQRGKVPMKFKSMQNGTTISTGVMSTNSNSDSMSGRSNTVTHVDNPNFRNNADRHINSSRSSHSEDSQWEGNGDQSPFSKFQENTLAKYKYKISTYYESSQNKPISVANTSSKPGILAGNENDVAIEEFKQANEKETMEKYHQRQIKVWKMQVFSLYTQ